jgi:hypothetical protein
VRGRIHRKLVVALATAAACVGVTAPLALGAWTSSASSSGTVSAASLGAPGGLAAAWGTCVKNVSFQVVLTWNAVSDARGYLVYRGTSSTGPWTQIGPTPVSGTTYTANGPSGTSFTWNVTYWYQVKAYAGGWSGSASTAVSNRTPKASSCT